MKYNDNELIFETKKLVDAEKKVTLAVLMHIREIEKRRLYAKRGFSSLFEFVVRELQYTESEAYKRISAMRFLKDMPEMEGKVSLSHAAKFQQFFSKEKLNKNEKLKLVEKLSNKSVRELEKELRVISPKAIPKQKIMTLTEKFTSLNFVVDEKVMEKLQKFKELYSHELKSESMENVFEKLLDVAINKKSVKSRATTRLVAKKRITKRSRYKSVAIRREITQRANHQCEYIDKVTNKRCEATRYLEFDHQVPYALGGETNLENMRLLCSSHNKLEAIEKLGEEKMRKYLSG